MEYTGKKTATKIETFSGISDMWLYNFDMYRKTLDNNWFRSDYTGKEKKVNPELLKPIEDLINEEYYTRINDVSFSNFIKDLAQIDALKMKYFGASVLVERMAKGFGNDVPQQEMRLRYITELKKYGNFKMEFIASVEEDYIALSQISEQIQGFKTSILLIQDKLKEKGSKESLSMSKQLKIISQGLQLGFALNSRLITVLDWIEYGEQLEEISKNN